MLNIDLSLFDVLNDKKLKNAVLLIRNSQLNQACEIIMLVGHFARK